MGWSRTLQGSGMSDVQNVLEVLYQARLEDLRQIASNNDIAKTGSVEQLRSRMITEMVLTNQDLSWEGIQNYSNEELGNFLGIFTKQANLLIH